MDPNAVEPTSVAPIWTLLVVGVFSGVVGSVVGPAIQRLFARNDRALDARRVWAREKLQTVFGVGDELHASDGLAHPYMRLVPPSGHTPHHYDMHSINPAVAQSVDLMMLQPKRSLWARDWLYNWHFILVPHAAMLHSWMHIIRRAYPEGGDETAIDKWVARQDAFEKANARYERRVLRVESALSIWSIGGWITHPSLAMWLVNRRVVLNWRLRTPKNYFDYTSHVDASCDCINYEELYAAAAAELVRENGARAKTSVIQAEAPSDAAFPERIVKRMASIARRIGALALGAGKTEHT
jgi:hypothetical protein